MIKFVIIYIIFRFIGYIGNNFLKRCYQTTNIPKDIKQYQEDIKAGVNVSSNYKTK